MRTQTSSVPICQAELPARYTAHIPRNFHAESSPMARHHIRGYDSPPPDRRCVIKDRTLARSQI